MKVLVTGSEGFLGSWIAAKAGPHQVIPFDSTLGDDIRSLGSVEQKMDGCDAVIHAAAVADLNESARNPGINFAVNIAGTEVVSSVAAKKRIPVLFVSTCCVYGNQQPAGLGTVPVPTELYAWSKLAGEAIIRGANPHNRIARMPTLYGPRMRPALFIYRVIDAVAKGEVVRIHGDGRQTRQYGYVEDVASLLWWQLESDKQILNLNPREATSCNDVVTMVASMLEKPARVIHDSDRPGQIVRQNILSTTNSFHRPFLQGLADTIRWYGSEHS